MYFIDSIPTVENEKIRASSCRILKVKTSVPPTWHTKENSSSAKQNQECQLH